MPKNKVYTPTVERKYFETRYFPYSCEYRNKIINLKERKDLKWKN